MTFLNRLTHLFMQPVADQATAEIYGACVAASRREEFYRVFGVPDTLDGRFDMLLLHVALVMRRLVDQPTIKQELFDLMFADMDRSLREMGVGDMSIGKKIMPMIQAFFGRAMAYTKALDDQDDLAVILRRNVYGKVAVDDGVCQKFAEQVRIMATALEQQDLADIITGKITFPALPVSL